jgi:hypothetical protein
LTAEFLYLLDGTQAGDDVELYSHLHEEIDVRLAEAESLGYGFDLPKSQLLQMLKKPL